MASKGNYYKYKTKAWFIKKGFQCVYLEQAQRIFTKGKVIFIKKDLFASDGLAMNEEEIIFWQSKQGRKNIAAAIKEYAKYKFPKWVKRWIVVWKPRVRDPDILQLEKEAEEQEYWAA